MAIKYIVYGSDQYAVYWNALMIFAISSQTNRIARILAGSKKKICTKKPRFMSACAQLIIAFLLILLQLGIIVALFLMDPPDVSRVCFVLWVGGELIERGLGVDKIEDIKKNELHEEKREVFVTSDGFWKHLTHATRD